MTRTMLACFLAAAAVAGAAGFEFTGRVNESWDKHEFELAVTGGGAKLWLGVPARCGLHVTARRDTATALDIHVAGSGPLELRGSGRYKVTVARDSGSGDWSCKDVGRTAELVSLAGFADTLFSPRIVFTTGADEAKWRFTWPRASAFFVQSIGPSGKAVEEIDLYYDNTFQFIGPGTATLVVKVTEGGGAYTAKLVQ